MKQKQQKKNKEKQFDPGLCSYINPFFSLQSDNVLLQPEIELTRFIVTVDTQDFMLYSHYKKTSNFRTSTHIDEYKIYEWVAVNLFRFI